MRQSYKVFIKEKVVVFTENINNCKVKKTDTLHEYRSLKELDAEFQLFIKNKRHKRLYIISNTNVDKLFAKFISNYHIIKASGGLVLNSFNHILMIYRHGRWDIPKGKKIKNEKNKKTALREVAEETGITKLQIVKKLTVTYHFFTEKNKLYIKKTRWYLMRNTLDQTPVPPHDEGITKVAWISKNEFNKISKGTYQSVKEVIASAKKYMKK